MRELWHIMDLHTFCCTNPLVQGRFLRHGLVAWGEQGASLAIALPDFDRYRKLADRVQYAQNLLGFTFIWVKENGEVVFDDAFSAGNSY